MSNFLLMSRNGTHCDEEHFQIALLRVNRDATTKKDKENFDVSNEGPSLHSYQSDVFSIERLKAMLHGEIFLATCNAILLLRDVKLPNTSLHYTPLMFSQHIENSSLISLINISQE